MFLNPLNLAISGTKVSLFQWNLSYLTSGYFGCLICPGVENPWGHYNQKVSRLHCQSVQCRSGTSWDSIWLPIVPTLMGAILPVPVRAFPMLSFWNRTKPRPLRLASVMACNVLPCLNGCKYSSLVTFLRTWSSSLWWCSVQQNFVPLLVKLLSLCGVIA